MLARPIRNAAPVVVALLFFALLTATWVAVHDVSTRWDPFDRLIEVAMQQQEPPACITTTWWSRGGDPTFPCSEVTVTTCAEEGEEPTATKARHKARVAEQMEVWPKAPDCPETE